MSESEIDDKFNQPPAPPKRTMTDNEIMSHLKWSEPREVQTKRGPKMVSEAKVFPEFFPLWNREKFNMSSKGYSLSEYRGQWKVARWSEVPEKIIIERKETAEMSRATDAEINVPCNEGMAYLGYQRAGIAFGHTRSGVLLADEMGLGKTVQAIGLINADPTMKRILVICPASLKINWKRELEKWLVTPRPIFIADSKIFPEMTGIVIVNYDVLHKHEAIIKGTEWDLLICDEAHACFPEGTMVSTGNGSIAIERIVKDKMRVLCSCQDLKKEIKTESVITGWYELKHYLKNIRIKHEFGTLECTEDHLIWIIGRGWVEAREVQCGEGLLVLREAISDPESLQSRHCISINEDCGRSGRTLTPHAEMEVSRSSKNGDTRISRVESIEILEPTNRHGTTVYCIDVEGHHNFFANGVLVHNCKNPKSRRSKMVLGMRATEKEKKNGAADIPGIDAKKRVLLTGTPICNKPVELFPLINYLDPINWGNFFKYALRYCAANNNGHGWDFSGASNLHELQEKLRSTIMIRRLKKDVLTELPPKRRQVIELPADGSAKAVARAEMAVYASRESRLEELQAKVELAKAADMPEAYAAAVAELHVGQGTVFSEMSKLRHDTTMAKLPACIDHLKEAVDESGKVVAFCHHKDAVRAIKEAFGTAAVTLVGDDAMIDRQASVDRFQKDPTCQLFIGSIMAAGVGITLTAAAHVVMVELDWVPGNVSQAEDRCHRIGQKESVLVQHLVLEGSLDAVMAKRVISKQDVIDRALDKVQDTATEEPATSKERHASDGTTRDQLAAEAERLTVDQLAAACEAIQLIAGICNGARSWDGAGFSKIDARIGKDLAALTNPSRKQCALARKIALKYRRQLPTELTERLK